MSPLGVLVEKICKTTLWQNQYNIVKLKKKKRNGIEINMPFWVFFSYLWHLVLSIKENRKFLSFTIH